MWLCIEWLSRHRLAMRPRHGMMSSSLWDWLWHKTQSKMVNRMSEKHSRSSASSLGDGRCETWFLHVGHEKSDELMDVVCRLEDASVVSQFLQHLQTLSDTYETLFQQMIYHWIDRFKDCKTERFTAGKRVSDFLNLLCLKQVFLAKFRSW